VTEPKTIMDDVGLLGEITTLAGTMTAQPRALPPGEWLEQCAVLEERLTASVNGAAYRHIVGNFAPLLLQAIRKSLAARRHGDERNAERFGALVGFLIEYVRADGRALLAAAHQ
jgi:hypothetical protein